MSVVSSSPKIGRQRQGNVSLKIIFLVFLTLTCIGIIYYFHWILAKDILFTHLFYVPVVLAGFWYGMRGVWIGILLGASLMAFHLLSGLDAPYWEDLLRSVMFFLVGLIVSILREHARRSEKATELAYAELDQIFNTAGGGMRLIDKDFNMLRVNETFSTLSGVSKDEAVGKKCYEGFSGLLCHTLDCTLTQILGGQKRVEYEVEKERNDGIKIPCILTATPLRGPRGELIGIVEDFRDITEQRRQQDKILAKERQLAHASRLSTLGEMATALSHEINQPLTLISMAAESILCDIKKNRIDMSLLPQDTEDILHNVRRIDTIITHMRTFARQPGEIKMVEPEQILNNAFVMVGGQLRVHDIAVSRHIEEALPPIEVDSNQLEQVFLNILANARQALDEKGKEAERADGSFQKQLKCSILQEGDHVVFEFADNGYGIPDEIKPRIFEPFFTTKEPGLGTGLGLSIAYGIIVQSHKGKIWVEDNEMGGATFKVALPIKIK
ncbi:MAG: ATP-binding protein [Thermodesulfobacteriota bacterium]